MPLPKSFGVARGWPLAAGRSAATAVAAPVGVWLPTIATPRACVLSPYRLLAAYAGPTMQLARSSDGATMDVYPAAGGQAPDVAAISAWAGSSALTVAKLYDQGSGGFDHVNAAPSARPAFSPSRAAVRGKLPVVFDGTVSGVAKELGNASLTLNRQAGGWLAAAAPLSQGINQYMRGFGTTSADRVLFLGTEGGASVFRAGLDASRGTPGWTARQDAQALGFIAAATGASILVDGQASTTAARAAGSANPGSWIGSFYAGGTALCDVALFADIVYAAAPAQADYDADRAALSAVFDIDAAYADALLADGDSITTGVGSSYGDNLLRQTAPLLSRRIALFNIGVPGQTAQTLTGTTAQSNSSAQMSAAQITGRKIVHYLAGTNDINALATGVAVGTAAGTVWSNYILPRLQYEISTLGRRVIVGTVTPRTGWSADGANKEAIRQAVNTLIRNNAATYGYAVADYDTASGLGSNLFDGVHPTSAGYALMAQVLAPVVNAALG